MSLHFCSSYLLNLCVLVLDALYNTQLSYEIGTILFLSSKPCYNVIPDQQQPGDVLYYFAHVSVMLHEISMIFSVLLSTFTKLFLILPVTKLSSPS